MMKSSQFPSTYVRDLWQQDVVAWPDDVAGKFAKDYRALRSRYTLLLTMTAIIETDADDFVHTRDWRQKVDIVLGYDAPSLGDYSVTIVSRVRNRYWNRPMEVNQLAREVKSSRVYFCLERKKIEWYRVKRKMAKFHYICRRRNLHVLLLRIMCLLLPNNRRQHAFYSCANKRVSKEK